MLSAAFPRLSIYTLFVMRFSSEDAQFCFAFWWSIVYLDPVDYFSFVSLLHSIKTDFVTRLCWVRECRTLFLGSLSIATVNSLDCMRKTGLLSQCCFLLFFYCSVRCSAFSFFLFFSFFLLIFIFPFLFECL